MLASSVDGSEARVAASCAISPSLRQPSRHLARHSHTAVGVANEKNIRRFDTTRTESAATVPSFTSTRILGCRPSGSPIGISSGEIVGASVVESATDGPIFHAARRKSSAAVAVAAAPPPSPSIRPTDSDPTSKDVKGGVGDRRRSQALPHGSTGSASQSSQQLSVSLSRHRPASPLVGAPWPKRSSTACRRLRDRRRVAGSLVTIRRPS